VVIEDFFSSLTSAYAAACEEGNRPPHTPREALRNFYAALPFARDIRLQEAAQQRQASAQAFIKSK